MNYIGSKHSIIDFIWESIIDVVGDKKNYSFCDIFAGTGVVGRYFKSYGYDIIANDNQYYSYVINKHFIENNDNITFSKLRSIGIDNVLGIGSNTIVKPKQPNPKKSSTIRLNLIKSGSPLGSAFWFL